MQPNQAYKILHSKKKKLKQTIYWMEENIYKWRYWQRLNFQNIQTAHQLNNNNNDKLQPNQKMGRQH